MVATIPISLPSVFILIFGLMANGLGVDIWGLTLANVMAFGRFFYVIQLLYVLLLTLIKLTLTFFYRNLFIGQTIYCLLTATIVAHIVIGVAFIRLIVF